MKNNEGTFHWLTSAQGHAEQRDYPMREDSLILAMTDLVLHPPYEQNALHSHNCMEIGLCLNGRGAIGMEGRAPQPYGSGTVLIIPQGARHSQQIDRYSDDRWLYIAVNQQRLLRETTPSCRTALEEMLHWHGGGLMVEDEAARGDIAWLIERMFDIKCMTPGDASAELEAIMLLVLMRASRKTPGQSLPREREPISRSPIEPALLYIAEQYRSEIKIAQLARSCAMSESYFRKIFSQVVGMPPIEYLNRYRIERAEQMLAREGAKSISHVAEECGFSSIATFNRNFLRYIGRNPTMVKKENAHHKANKADEIVQNG